MKNADPVINLLRAVPGWSRQPQKILAAIAQLVDHVDISPGQVLAREGTVAREAFVVVDGEGDVYIDGERVAGVGPGDFVGEMGMLDHRPRCATVRARTAMQVLVIGPAAFSTLVQSPQVPRTMALQLAARLRRAESSTEPQDPSNAVRRDHVSQPF